MLVTFFFLTTYLNTKTFQKVYPQDILIFGSDFFSKNDILNNSSLKLPTPLIFVKTIFTEKELKRNLSLENVSVSRQIFPFGLKILIQTRTPIAYGDKILKGEKINGFIDKEGFFIDEKHSDKESIKKLSVKVFGWKENFKEILSKIFYFQKNNNVEFVTIEFSPNGFLTLEEKTLKTILLGIEPKRIETQLQIIEDIKNQIKDTKVLKKIDNIDLTDPHNPKIKVFKP
ncbi:Cell division septal protein [Prochlorococcus marinus str. MIT 9515]|uniref:Cell division septal protein n=1 Tax=Prochlorococcus marinus (strain MIT 9515) TaxID=167542 RepID=A2BY15_PROM5|nr:Cell division septal protein [Prochlorococcus marinus str. MIT 9515]